ncbi:hypothetical protein EBE87_09745 [Pseudoroseomonas wenyumeiae]|uniref:Uncharacterized protein n=1 Tax=Teichococcus wenyumeiae TaxID=2478470 RepID=A0A3A9JQF6_9PROT|nr:hypothetical protein [Pseudoroseomonas wenyumeiae]RKK02868.1 hypothetical protein D6Z83_17500 [Pseudoroseomonas wenyumeiae]RMI25409.1 hypothetical protein EBE87_09745 [Pseudoroseomonas wenyumeiae]
MRVPPAAFILNGLGWVVILALVAAALALVRLLGFPGLLILGLLCCLICTRAELSEDVPSWGRQVFAARMARAGEAPDRAAFRFYRRCGCVLLLAGLAGTAWQWWGML